MPDARWRRHPETGIQDHRAQCPPAHRLNFLLDQARLALDPRTEPGHRERAEREIDELLRIMPTPRQLADVLAVTRDSVQTIPR